MSIKPNLVIRTDPFQYSGTKEFKVKLYDIFDIVLEDLSTGEEWFLISNDLNIVKPLNISEENTGEMKGNCCQGCGDPTVHFMFEACAVGTEEIVFHFKIGDEEENKPRYMITYSVSITE